MTRIFGNRRKGVAYFVRRSREGCSVIELHTDDREEIVESGLALADAENLCARKIDDMRIAGAPDSLDLLEPGPRQQMKRRTRQLAFKF
jgi:hypothetical protein